MKLLSFLILFVFSINSFAQCFPKNNLNISSYMKSINGITQEDFLKAVEDMKEIYSPIFELDYDSSLVIEANWEDGTVNAYAQQTGKIWKVSMFGGLARHPETTLDGFAAVICHEIGHHIAGAPKKAFSYGGVSWAANEGQSDYYATTKCLRKYFSSKEQLRETYKIYRAEETDSENLFAKNKCSETYKNFKEKAVCYRSTLAGKSLARLLGSLSGNADVVFSTPDSNVVLKTNHNHPKAQCRMDTYFQGSLCVNNMDELADPMDVRVGYCTAIEQFKIGLRPSCWYNSSEYEK